MATVIARKEESLESLMKRFKKKVENEEILKDWKDKEFFEKPSAARHRNRRAAIRRQQQKSQKLKEKFDRR
jgi:small subunit ribosomal protein S21